MDEGIVQRPRPSTLYLLDGIEVAAVLPTEPAEGLKAGEGWLPALDGDGGANSGGVEGS